MPTDQPARAPTPELEDDDDLVAAPPSMPVQSALYITPDGQVQFGALFDELVPIAQALDPSYKTDENQ